MDALFARAARLPKVPFAAPERVISQTTTAALQSGLVYGFAGQVDAIVDRIRAELGALDAPVVATGGLADLIAPHSADDHRRRPGADPAGAAPRLGAEPRLGSNSRPGSPAANQIRRRRT